MRAQEIVGTIAKLGSAEKWLRIISAAVVMGLMLSIGFVVPARAEGAVQISGIFEWAGDGECVDYPADFALKFTDGPLKGCMYVTVETDVWHPSGTYMETGTDFFDITDSPFGAGTFSSTYRFQGMYTTFEDIYSPEIHGGCRHPIIAGSGTGAFAGVTGHFAMRDDIAAGNMPISGHLKW